MNRINPRVFTLLRTDIRVTRRGALLVRLNVALQPAHATPTVSLRDRTSGYVRRPESSPNRCQLNRLPIQYDRHRPFRYR